MTETRKLSVSDKLVLAMNIVEKATGQGVSAEDLVVQAWKEFPETFGLRGQVDEQGRSLYPDSNRVFSEIMGAKPLRAKGLIEKVGDKTYRLTTAGRNLADDLLGVEEGPRRASLKRDEVAKLQRQLTARARLKYVDDRLDDITFTDACMFWGITAASGRSKFESRRSDVLGLLARARSALGDATRMSMDNGGRTVFTAADLASVAEVDEFLMTKFTKEVATMRMRDDR